MGLLDDNPRKRLLGLLEEAPDTEYGTILPFAQGPDKQMRFAMPSIMRGPLKGILQLMGGPSEAMQWQQNADGTLTPKLADDALEGLMALHGAGALGLGNRAVPLASRSGSMYNPPSRPQRPFEKDYPHGAPADGAGRLTHDIDGRPLQVGGRVVGRTVAGGADEALSPTEFDAIATASVGAPAKVASLSGRDLGRVAVNPYSRLPESVALSNKLTPSQLPKVYGHEIGHVIDQMAGEIPTNRLSGELKKIYDTLNNPNRTRDGAEAADWGKPMTPQGFGYKDADVPREYMAEAIRAYMANPNYIKKEAPETAAAIRAAVNAHPELSRIIQFNTGGSPIPLAPYLGRGLLSDDEN